jgi:uncharacterized Zn-finger protein
MTFKLCADCGQDILVENAEICPYCHGTNLVIDTRAIERLKRAGKYEEAAKLYEEMDMWEEAAECRRIDKTSYVVSANLKIGKVGTITMNCPYCIASQPLYSKSNEVTCSSCKKTYVIPKKVLDLL